jgi:uncharacterized membrane protein
MNENIFPITIAEYNKKFLLGLVELTITVEDRRAKDPSRNIKHLITIRIVKKLFSIIIRSSTTGHYNLNGFDLTFKNSNE